MASVLGTVVFVMVFMLSLGSLAYVSGLEAQTSQAQLQAQAVAAARAGESLSFGGSQSQLYVQNSGPATVDLNHVVLRYPNGTAYALAAAAVVPTGMQVAVSPLVPPGVCTPGTATCLSKYDAIVAGAAPGASVGVVTSQGNVFWYSPGAGGTAWEKVVYAASGTWDVPPGVSQAYVVCIGGGGGGGGE